MSDEFEAEAKRLFECAHNNFGWKPIEESLRKAYEGGRAEEREACARIAKEFRISPRMGPAFARSSDAGAMLGAEIAVAIRAQAAKDKAA